MIYCKDCLNDGNCINPGYYNASLRSECFRDKNGEKLKPSVAEILNSQPIHKAPSFQTEGEAREKLNRIIPWGLIESQNEEAFLSAFIGNLKDAGLIRKSSLVELVEEAEWICKRTDVTYEQIISKLRDALQALKKDHPEFGGKK